VFHKKEETNHSKKHDQRIGTSLLREANVVSHEGKRKGAGKGNVRREQSCKKINHGYGEHSKDERNNTQISFRFFKWIKKMRENKEKRRMKIRRLIFKIIYLSFEIISRIVERVDFI
jgi:hypothetical protein